MTRLRTSWTTAAAILFLLSACARTDASSGSGAGADPSSEPPATGADALVLRIERFGGFVAPDQQIGRLPVVSVYADGRVISEGPRIAIFPGPALPNVVVQQFSPDAVKSLTDKAAAAGVRAGADLGQPNVADAPTTRITLVTAGGTRTVDVIALDEAQAGDPRLSAAQRDGRATLAAYVKQVSDMSALTTPASKPYVPASIAAFASPYTAQPNGLPTQPPAVAWSGAALPGEPFGVRPGMGCVIADGSQAQQVLAAAKKANAITPWTSGGKQWTIVFRPLLPDESACADLKGVR
jgi:hypothetical protein